MTGNSNPIDLVFVDGVDPSKADVRAFMKQHAALLVANAAEINSTDLSGQQLILLKSTGRTYTLNTLDTTTPDDGSTFIRDANGLGFELETIDGVDGADGADPGILFTWDTATADANPASGALRANNVSLASATLLYISKTSRAGNSISAFLAALDDSTNATAKGTLTVTDTADETQATFLVGAVTDASGYIKLAVSGQSGATAFANGVAISFQFARAGDAGAVQGPGSSTDGGFAKWNGTGALTLKDSAAVIAMADGGTGAVLVDPNADRILFWDDSAGSMAFLTPSAGLVISGTNIHLRESIIIAVSDETTALTIGTSKVKFRMPYAFTLTDVRGALSTAQASGSIFTVDVNQVTGSPDNPSSLLSMKLTIDNTEKTSLSAATPVVLSSPSVIDLIDDIEITIDIDQVGDGTAKGLKIVLIGYQP